jgi:hypothetical protein
VKVFLKVQGDSTNLQKTLSGSKYTQGIDIDLVLDDNQKIIGFKMQDIEQETFLKILSSGKKDPHGECMRN